MRIFLLITCLFMAVATPLRSAGSQPARRLAQLLANMRKGQEVTPDSFYTHVETLRDIIRQEQDSVNKAVYNATLAHMLVMNIHRAQSHGHRTESHPDSLREWSLQEYFRQAALLYGKALSSPHLLHRVPVTDWLPLVDRPSSDKPQSADMLSFIWQNAVDEIPPAYRAEAHFPSYARLIALHKQEGRLRDALYLTLDSMRQNWNQIQDSTLLQNLLQEYATCDAAAEIYLHLSQRSGLTPEQRQSILQKGMDSYPKYWRLNALKNAMRQLSHPQLEWRIARGYCPQQAIHTELSARNLSSASFALYRLPKDFDEGQPRLLSKVQSTGKLIRTFHHRFQKASPISTIKDTLHWQTPTYGHYAMVVRGSTSAPLCEKPSAQVLFFRVSSLGSFSVSFPNGRLRHIVVDAATGAPVSGAEVSYLKWEKGAHKLYKKEITDHRGITELDASQLPRTGISMRISKGSDNAQEAFNINTSYFPFHITSTPPANHVHLFTDRGVYRPGQKVYVAALAYTDRGRKSSVNEGTEITLTYLDENARELAKHTLRTDAFGVAQDSLTLPSTVLPGTFRIRVQGASGCSFRVEEYKRPTFKVQFDTPSSVRWPVDSIHLTGTVSTYSGVPLTEARITGTYQWRQSLWYFMPHSSLDEAKQIDTLFTDADGRFSLHIPVEADAEAYRRGRRLSVQVDALSTYGETQHGHFGMPLCSSPLRLLSGLPRWQDRQKLTPWTIELIGPSDRPITASISCTLRKADGQEVFHTQIPAGKPVIPDGLIDVPSGAYTLHARAQVGADTASCSLPFTLFGLADKHLPVDTALWVYCPRDTFSDTQPALVQIGSSLDTAHIFLTLVSPSGIAMDTLMTFHRQSEVITIPYQDQYADGAQLHVGLYHDGQFFQASPRLHHQLPSRKIALQWHTFRDHLQPGQQEEWRLSVLLPDGTPAQANLMCTLYDASLDAIAQHRMRFSLFEGHSIPMLNTYAQKFYPRFHALPFCLRMYKEDSYRHPGWEQRYFRPPFAIVEDCAEVTQTTTESNLVLRGTAVNAKMMKSPMVASRSFAEASLTAKEEMSDKAAGGEKEDTGTDMPSPELRTQLHELAFFFPNLRTDDQGQISLAFTLPQGLTSWRLQGMAHTRDMRMTWLDDTIVARKDFMAQLHLPRYLREGDRATITATLRNLTDETMKGLATLEIRDARSKELLHTAEVKDFILDAKGTSTHRFPLDIPKEHPLLLISWRAQTPKASDGEQHALAVLSDEQVITETKSFQLDGPGEWETDLKKLFAFDHNKAIGRTLTVEYTARPIWLALQALPSLTEEKPTDAIAMATACYATTMARHIAFRVPALRQAISQWEKESQPPTMEHNAALTDLLRQEMPWMAEEQQETNRRQQLADLMTRAYAPAHLMAITRQLADMQQADGTFAWYPGMKGNTYLTAQILRMMARLQETGKQDNLPEAAQLRSDIIRQGLKALHRQLALQDERGEPALTNVLDFLYILQQSEVPASKEMNSDASKWTDWLKRKAEKLTRHQRAQAAVVLHACGEEAAAQRLMPELKRLITQPDGYYLAYPGGAHLQSDSKVQHHVDVMEAFHLLAPKDTVVLQGLQRRLLMQKRTQDWEQPISTADAIHALVRTGGTTPADVSTDVITLTDGRKSQQLSSPETALGYLRCSMETTRPRRLKIQKSGPGISWGTVYAQYRMPMSEVQAQREGLSIRRDISAEKVLTGDRLHVRYTLTVDQDMEFVCLSAPRMAAAEPDTPLSGYVRWGNIGAYRAIHDARTDYFFDQLPRGTYVVEEDWLITAPGTYQLGAATLRSVYAPAFQAHTTGQSIEISDK